MSAVSICVADNGVVFASDGAAYDADGHLLYSTTKIYSGSRGDFLFSHVGLGAFGECLSHEIDDANLVFDDLKDKIVEMSKVAYEIASLDWIGQPSIPRATLIMAGWSEKNHCYEAFKLHSSEKAVTNFHGDEISVSPPWQLLPVKGIWASSMPKPEDYERFGIDFSSDYSLVDMPARLVCANRASSGDRGDAVYGVGCFLEMAIMAEGKITRWIAHEWPDKIGFPIDPDAGEPMPMFPLHIPQK